MAFVFRENKKSFFDKTNDLTISKQIYNYPNDSPTFIISQSDVQENKKHKKSPIKGLTFIQSLNKAQSHVPNKFILKSTSVSILKDDYINQVRKDNASSNKQNYFFKSKLNRNYQQDFSHLKALNEKNMSKDKQCLKICNISQSTRKKIKQNYIVNRSINKTFKENNEVGKIPSIPSQKHKYGYVIKQQHFYFPRLVQQMKYSGQKECMPGPADYSPHKAKKQKTLVKMSVNTNELPPLNICSIDSDNQKIVIEEQANKKGKQKIKLMKRNISRNRNSSSSSQQYVRDAVPGPGYYSTKFNNRPNFRSQKQHLTKIFYSNQKRFQQNQIYQQVTHVKQDNEKLQTKKRKNMHFISKSVRHLQLNDCNHNPPPGYYQTRNNIENNSVTKALKGSSNSCFLTQAKRFEDSNNDFIPGPGYYLQSVDYLQTKDTLTYPFKSTLKRDIQIVRKKTQKIDQLISTEQTIHSTHKLQQIEQKIIKPCFESSQPRFVYPKVQEKMQYKLNLSPKKLIWQNQQPFNSSSPKDSQIIVGDGVGVGSYNIQCQTAWNKRTYNILFA